MSWSVRKSCKPPHIKRDLLCVSWLQLFFCFKAVKHALTLRSPLWHTLDKNLHALAGSESNRICLLLLFHLIETLYIVQKIYREISIELGVNIRDVVEFNNRKNKNVTLVLQYSCSMTCICVQSIEMTTIDHCVGSSINFCDKLSSLDWLAPYVCSTDLVCHFSESVDEILPSTY